ncbi:hypothetical protein O6H91_Y570800 [Diphasiastrum complanatum]|nr:hypothetical protein O6H91_Y570800 [Diphasiastrum complanatum]
MASNLQSHWKHFAQKLPPQLLYVKEELDLRKALIAIAVAAVVFTLFSMFASKNKKKFPPAVPGLPIVGNLLQLMDRKPHRSFTSWSLLNQAMVTKYESISKRELGTSLNILTCQKTMVAMSDYGVEHRFLKKIVMANLLGPSPQRENRAIRASELEKMLESLHSELKSFPLSTCEVELQSYFAIPNFLNKLLLKNLFHMLFTFGRDIEEVHVAGLGSFSKWEIFDILVSEPLRGAILAKQIESRRSKVIKALIEEQRKNLAGKAVRSYYSYVDTLLANYQNLNDTQLLMSVWEPVIESSDTTLASQPSKQERLYQEIREVVGDRPVTEDDLANLPYLTAVIKETLRKYTPVPLLPPRFVEQDIQIGGYDIPAGWHILINMYGINHDKKTWPEPDTWDPDRLLGDQNLTWAMYLIPMYVASFVQNFKWILPATEVHEEDTIFLTTHKLHPLKAIATPRSQQ